MSRKVMKESEKLHLLRGLKKSRKTVPKIVITGETVEIDDESKLSEFPETSGVMKYLLPLHLLLLWVFPLIIKGARKNLNLKDVPKLSKSLRFDHHTKHFDYLFHKFQCFGQIRLAVALYCVLWCDFLLSGVFKLVGTILALIYPIFLKKFLENMQPQLTPEDRTNFDNYQTMLPSELRPKRGSFHELGFRTSNYIIWLWLVLMVLFQGLSYVMSLYGYYIATKMGKKMKLILMDSIYRKSFNISKGRDKFTKGGVINYVTYDCFTVDWAQSNIHEVWTAVLLVVFSTFFLVKLMGLIVFFSYIFFVFALVIMFFLVCFIFILRLKHASVFDKRVEKMKQFFTDILVIKFFTLEDNFLTQIFNFRLKEVNYLKVIFVLRSVANALSYATPPIMTGIGFTIYYFVNNKIDIIILLTSLTYFTLLRTPLAEISIGAIRVFSNFVSMWRIQKFLAQPNRKVDLTNYKNSTEKRPGISAVSIENGNFSWYKSTRNKEKMNSMELEDRFSLKNINVKIERNELVMVIGKTCSGKTAFVKSLLNELYIETGNISVNGSLAYCDQFPYIENGSVLNNILFRKEYDKERFREILRICSLVRDLENFDDGINEEIGENGSTLSGGQKSRLSLARAVYSESDILILDNVLGPLDSYCANFIMQRCILKYLKEKTVILVTNKTEFLKFADKVLLFERGEIVHHGSYKELCKKRGKYTGGIIKPIQEVQELVVEQVESESEEEKDEKNDLLPKNEITRIEENNPKFEANFSMRKKLIVYEERVRGIIPYQSIWAYVKNLRCCCFTGIYSLFFILVVYTVGLGCYVLTTFHITNLSSLDYYHNIWGNVFNASFYQNKTYDEFNNTIYSKPYYYNPNDYNSTCLLHDVSCGNKLVEIFWEDYRNGTLLKRGISNELSLGIYAFLCLLVFVFITVASYIAFSSFLNSSDSLFRKAIKNLVFTSMRFFYRQPIGRVLSRLSLDVLRTDYYLTIGLEFFITCVFLVIACFGLVCAATYGIFVPIVMLCFLLIFCAYLFFRKTTIELKRLESLSRSNLVHHLNQSLEGKLTIESYGLKGKYVEQNGKNLNVYIRPDFFQETIRLMINMYLKLCGLLSISVICFFGVLFSYYVPIKGIVNMMALGITNIILVVDVLGVLHSTLVGMEMEMNSIERLDYYGKFVEKEDDETKDETLISNGKIEFKNYSMRYQDDYPLVLKNIYLMIKPNDKISIIGRTGCGKTSLFLALCRIIERDKGEIFIDDQNIFDFSIKSLRRQISVIPQNPVLFADRSIRFNLDPFRENSDKQITDTLVEFGLQDTVDRENGLNGIIKENGKNFSVGEQRLLCLIRAILKRSSIILLDECTSVDSKIDCLIQDKVTKLPNTTVLSITHNLKNLKFYQKVIVMDEGKIVEFDKVKNLLDKESSFLKQFLNLISNGEEILQTLKML